MPLHVREWINKQIRESISKCRQVCPKGGSNSLVSHTSDTSLPAITSRRNASMHANRLLSKRRQRISMCQQVCHKAQCIGAPIEFRTNNLVIIDLARWEQLLLVDVHLWTRMNYQTKETKVMHTLWKMTIYRVTLPIPQKKKKKEKKKRLFENRTAWNRQFPRK